MIDKLQHQVRLYKKQLEEAEDIASNNLAKYKLVQKVIVTDLMSLNSPLMSQGLVNATERAGECELELDRKRGASRAASMAREFC